ncbi:MAG: excalibur calcium-binding domain-containing protein [Actinomycetes bacterium]
MLRWLLLVVAAVAIIAAGVFAALQPPAPGPVYATCADANDAGVSDIPEGSSAYWSGGDRDHDGYACDSPNK